MFTVLTVMLRIYIAASSRDRALEVKAALVAANHEISSTWHDLDFLRTSRHTVEERLEIAERDINEIGDCNVLVLLAEPPGPDGTKLMCPGGKFVEAGAALALRKLVIVLGNRENMLLWHPRVQQVESLPDLLALLR